MSERSISPCFKLTAQKARWFLEKCFNNGLAFFHQCPKNIVEEEIVTKKDPLWNFSSPSGGGGGGISSPRISELSEVKRLSSRTWKSAE